MSLAFKIDHDAMLSELQIYLTFVIKLKYNSCGGKYLYTEKTTV